MGAMDEVKGRVKEAAGVLTGRGDMKRKGKADQVAGKAKDVVDNVREKASEAADSLRDRTKDK